jgi:hypothetical protein
VYLGYHPNMSRSHDMRLRLALALVCMLPCACASKLPNPEPLCGTWSDGAVTERWWQDGDNLRGEGQAADEAGQVHTTEIFELVASRSGHIYVARPGGGAPTEFAPIDPADVRFDLNVPEGAQAWVWANYEHDYPQEIRYVLVGNRLHTEIIGPGDDPGQSKGSAMGWTLERTAACGAEKKP